MPKIQKSLIGKGPSGIRYHITIPPEIINHMKWNKGDDLMFMLKNDQVILKKSEIVATKKTIKPVAVAKKEEPIEEPVIIEEPIGEPVIIEEPIEEPQHMENLINEIMTGEPEEPEEEIKPLPLAPPPPPPPPPKPKKVIDPFENLEI